MLQNVFSAVAKSANLIEFSVSKEFSNAPQHSFKFYADGVFQSEVKPISTSESPLCHIYTIIVKGANYLPGHEYAIVTENNYQVMIDISYLANSKKFEETYRCDLPMGALYTPQSTTFRVFSPFSTSIILKIKRKDASAVECYEMKHDFKNGIFEITLDGDFDEAEYVYERMMFGKAEDCVDPYALSLSSNGRKAFVIDKEKIRSLPSFAECLPPLEDKTKAVIYEADVRDMTSLTDIQNKGTFAALSQEGLVDEGGMPMGLDYLASLGVSHIQLMPVLDFQSVNEDDPQGSYNWGYDPYSFFAPEGSYSTNPNHPYARVLELKRMIGQFHKKGLRVVLDVVYNHFYSETFNAVSVLCPNYYFRHDGNGYLANGTGCGNDVESRNYMVRKMILDSLNMLVDLYDVDGIRFDLMGILDVETINLGYQQLSKKKPDILYYGEGWDMWTPLPFDKKASYFNADQMPDVSFFNDRFRDVIKGKSNDAEITVRGYLLGDINYRDGFKHVMLGSVVPIAFAPMFSLASQSINYVECHDNYTLYDKIRRACPADTDEEIFRRLKMHTMTILLSDGIPFFHAGQEIGATKQGNGNSYNAGDVINGFDYALLDERKELYYFFQDALAFRRKLISEAGKEYGDFISSPIFENLDGGGLKISYELKNRTYYVIINPTKEVFLYDFGDGVQLVFSDSGLVSGSGYTVQLGIIPALSFTVYCQEENKPVLTHADIKKGESL